MSDSTHCAICREDFAENDRLVFNKKETFVFKPADVPDTVNAAKVSSDELLESRKEHLRTEVATVFHLYGRAEIPDVAFNVRHVRCGLQDTAAGYVHPLLKHSIRYQRSAVRRA